MITKQLAQLQLLFFAGVFPFVAGCGERELDAQPNAEKDSKIKIPEISFTELVELANQSDEVFPGNLRTMRVLDKDRIEVSVGTSVEPMSGGGQMIQFLRKSGKWEVVSVEPMDF